MSEYGAGLTVWRRDGAAVTEDEAEGLVEQMMTIAAAAGRWGSFDDEAPDCGLGWEEDGGGYTLVATSSAAYKFGLPEDLAESSLAHDVAYAEWLGAQLEQKHPGTYRYEASDQEW